jgi:flagellin-like protein
LKLSLRRRRPGLSELTGTLLMVGITLVAGAAVIGWVNGQASTSENAYGNSVANNVDFLQERFAMVTQTFGSSSGGACSGGTSPNFQCTAASFWVYNSGKVAFTLYSIQIKNLTDIPKTFANPNPLNILFYAGANSACASGTQNCGFVYYNKAGSTAICSDTNALAAVAGGGYQPGFYQNSLPPVSLPQNQLTPNPYQIMMPPNTYGTGSACATQYLYDGLSYTFTFTGLYGNVFSTTLTVNG